MDKNRMKVVVKGTTLMSSMDQTFFYSLSEAFHYVAQEMQKLHEDQVSEIYISKQVKAQKQPDNSHNLFQYQSSYDSQLIKQQMLLFDNDNQIRNFIQTEKLLAENAINQLTDLCFCLMKISKDLLKRPRPLIDMSIKDQNYNKERLDRIEQECMNTLMRVKEERRRIQNCCICLSEKSSFVLIPCMHMVLCGRCGVGLQKCPICSHNIKQIKQIYH